MDTKSGSYMGISWSEVIHYTCHQNDNWARIAYEMYDDEMYMSLLMAVNPQYASVLLFDGGEVLTVPVIDEELSGALPPWRTSA